MHNVNIYPQPMPPGIRLFLCPTTPIRDIVYQFTGKSLSLFPYQKNILQNVSRVYKRKKDLRLYLCPLPFGRSGWPGDDGPYDHDHLHPTPYAQRILRNVSRAWIHYSRNISTGEGSI